jgi:uncharacterized membrane protein YsdA (DUF1294 family)
MMHDKRLSMRKNNNERIPEGILFFMSTILGSLGIYLGMIICRHKNRKWYFAVGIPLLLIQNIGMLYILHLAINHFLLVCPECPDKVCSQHTLFAPGMNGPI